MKALLQKLLALETESELVEFKEAKARYDTDKMGRYFSALSNEANLKGQSQAWIVLGVRDNRSIVGTTLDERTINKLKKDMGEHTSPRMTFMDVHRVATDQGDVLLFEIPTGKTGQIVSWKGHAYGRDGESLVALHDHERKQIENQILDDWSYQIIPEASLEDLHGDAIKMARQNFFKKNKQFSEYQEDWNHKRFLDKAKSTINGKITNTAILLLGKPESEHFISPATSKISWILKDIHGVTKDYEHFSCPLILMVDRVYQKIRNLKYRYIADGTLFPQEVDQYDPYLIREALHNCIAHQDYTKGGKINLIEKEDGSLIFSNRADFIPKSVEHVVLTDTPETIYRNAFLANAMVAIGMIDTVGSGIKRMYLIQKKKFFPLPEYDVSGGQVQLTITGKVLDFNYARKLANIDDLTLQEIILLDKVSKNKTISIGEAKLLRGKNLIEGRRPNYYISSELAKVTGGEGEYMKRRGIDDDYCQKVILDYLGRFGQGRRKDFEGVLLDKLPDALNQNQKKTKVKNNLQKLRIEGKIKNNFGLWTLSN